VEIRKGRIINVLHIPPQRNTRKQDVVILVHGACARMQQLVFIIRDLMDKGYEVVAYDALGCGMSDKPTAQDSYGTEAMYKDMIEVIRRYSPRNQKAVSVIGHSIGGAMLARFAASSDCESLTESVIAITPPIFGDRPTSNRTSVFKLPISLLWLIRPWMSVQARKLLFGPNATDTLKNTEREASGRNPVYMFKAFYNSIDQDFLSIKDTKLNVPSLFIGAEFDKVCPAEPIEALSKRLSANYVLAKDCGHQCMQEDPKQINSIIGRFFKSLE
jgi:pimeloyl-ACP methyl ester carboxylesterase